MKYYCGGDSQQPTWVCVLGGGGGTQLGRCPQVPTWAFSLPKRTDDDNKETDESRATFSTALVLYVSGNQQ